MRDTGASLNDILCRSFRAVTSLVVVLVLLVSAVLAVDLFAVAPTFRHTQALTRAIRAVHEGMVDEETGVRGYLLSTSADAVLFLEPYETGRQSVAANMSRANREVSGDRSIALLVAAMGARSREWEERWATVAIAQGHGRGDLETFVGDGKRLFDRYRAAEKAVLAALLSQQDRILRVLHASLATGLALGMLAGLGVVYGVARQRRRLAAAMVAPIARLTDSVGRIRDGDLSSRPTQLGPGARELTRLIGDVSDMAAALASRDRALRTSTSMMIEAQRLAQIGSWEWDPSHGTLTWSRQMHALCGTDPSSGAPSGGLGAFLDVVVMNDRDAMSSCLGRLLATGGKDTVSHGVARRDGATRQVITWLEVIPGPDGSPERVRGSSQDITQRWEAERALTASEARYRLIAQHSSDLISRHDVADGRLSYVSPAARTLLGVAPEALLAVGELPLHPDDATHTRAQLAAVATGSGTVRVTYRVRHTDGRWLWVETLASAVRNQHGCITEFHATTRDVSERMETQRALTLARDAAADARDAALAATAAKSTFLATMSHEIRTPMNAVIALTGLLLDTDLDDHQRDLAETVRSSGDALLGLLNDILDFSKIEAGELSLEQAPFALRPCVEEAVELLSGIGTAKGLGIGCVVDDSCPDWVVGDKTRLRQILVNVVDNAVKFTARGDVLVTVARKSTVDTRAVVQFSVTDTGIGIPADRLGDLFTSFTQVDASTTRLYGGTGLGLAICHRLVEAMGGTLDVASTIGAGTTVTFTIPLLSTTPNPEAADSPATRAGELTITSPEGDGLRVLLAEDNAVNQKVGRLLLRRLGHEVDVVADGHEAVDAVRQVHYDVVLMDIHMPGCDGLDATATIRSDLPADRQPYIIALTASALASDRSACVAAGMDDYLAKPVRPSDLARVLARVTRSVALEAGGEAAERPAPLDRGIFEGLIDQFGAESPVTRDALIDTYLEQATRWMDDLTAAAAKADFTTAAALAQALRSSSALLGALPLAALLDRAATACATSTHPVALSLTSAASGELSRVRDALAHQRHHSGPGPEPSLRRTPPAAAHHTGDQKDAEDDH